MYSPAIVVVGYNRPVQTRRLLDSIGHATYDRENITLVISIDESELSDRVERVAQDFEWKYGEKIIRRFPQRQGLRKHIISCGDLAEQYGAVIILEDDLYVSPDYYKYVCEVHEFYSDNINICGVSLYNFERIPFTNYVFTPDTSAYDTYLGGMVVTWGQSWSAEQWKRFKKWYQEHEDKLPADNVSIPDEISGWTRSWGKYFSSYMAENKLYYVYPYISRTTCFSDIGEHNKSALNTSISQVRLMSDSVDKYNFAPFDNAIRYDSFYERELPQRFMVLDGISGNDICFDLNGMKRNSLVCRYIITHKKLPYKKLASYGLSMRPVDRNVIENIPGDYYNLYDLGGVNVDLPVKKKKKYNYEQSYERLRYEHFDMTWKMLLFYICNEIITLIRRKINL